MLACTDAVLGYYYVHEEKLAYFYAFFHSIAYCQREGIINKKSKTGGMSRLLFIEKIFSRTYMGLKE